MSKETIPPSQGSDISALLSSPDYFRIWAVGGLTGIVRWLQLLVFGVYSFEITGSPLLVSLVPVFFMLPLALCGPLIGVMADRVNRKLLLCFSLVGIGIVSGTMAFIATIDTLTFGHITLASVLSGVFWATDMPVRRRLMGDLSAGALSTAMSLDSATGNATRMFGPLLGGVMLQTFSIAGVFILSAVIYMLCLLLSVLLRMPSLRSQSIVLSQAFFRELSTGLRFVYADSRLRRIFVVTIIFNIWGFPFTSMVPVLGKERLDLDPFLVGLLSSMEGFGAFIGALMIAAFVTRGVFYLVYFSGTLVYLLMVGYLGVLSSVAGGPLHSYIAVSVSLVVIGMAGACFAAMQSTLTYLNAPPELRSRVLGVLTLCIGTGPIGFFNVGWMAEIFGVSTALLIISAEGLFALLVLWIYGETVRIDDQPANAPVDQ